MRPDSTAGQSVVGGLRQRFHWRNGRLNMPLPSIQNNGDELPHTTPPQEQKRPHLTVRCGRSSGCDVNGAGWGRPTGRRKSPGRAGAYKRFRPWCLGPILGPTAPSANFAARSPNSRRPPRRPRLPASPDACRQLAGTPSCEPCLVVHLRQIGSIFQPPCGWQRVAGRAGKPVVEPMAASGPLLEALLQLDFVGPRSPQQYHQFCGLSTLPDGL